MTMWFCAPGCCLPSRTRHFATRQCQAARSKPLSSLAVRSSLLDLVQRVQSASSLLVCLHCPFFLSLESRLPLTMTASTPGKDGTSPVKKVVSPAIARRASSSSNEIELNVAVRADNKPATTAHRSASPRAGIAGKSTLGPASTPAPVSNLAIVPAVPDLLATIARLEAENASLRQQIKDRDRELAIDAFTEALHSCVVRHHRRAHAISIQQADPISSRLRSRPTRSARPCRSSSATRPRCRPSSRRRSTFALRVSASPSPTSPSTAWTRTQPSGLLVSCEFEARRPLL